MHKIHASASDTIRQLLQSATPTSTIYALYKLSNNLPRRDRRQARKALHTVFSEKTAPNTANIKTKLCSATHASVVQQRPFGNSYATVSLKQDTLFHRYTSQARNWCAKNIRHYSRFFTIGTKHTTWQPNQGSPRALARNCHRLFHRITSTTITLPYNWRNSNPSNSFLAYLGKSKHFTQALTIGRAIDQIYQILPPPLPHTVQTPQQPSNLRISNSLSTAVTIANTLRTLTFKRSSMFKQQLPSGNHTLRRPIS